MLPDYCPDIQKILRCEVVPSLLLTAVNGDKLSVDNRTTNIVVQLETVQAVEHIDEIVQSDFIDMFFIGPGDLSMDMGIFAQFSNPRLTDTIMLLREKTARAGKRLGIFAGNFDAARNWYAKGFDMCIINSELALLSSAVAGEVGKLRSELEAGK